MNINRITRLCFLVVYDDGAGANEKVKQMNTKKQVRKSVGYTSQFAILLKHN